MYKRQIQTTVIFFTIIILIIFSVYLTNRSIYMEKLETEPPNFSTWDLIIINIGSYVHQNYLIFFIVVFLLYLVLWKLSFAGKKSV